MPRRQALATHPDAEQPRAHDVPAEVVRQSAHWCDVKLVTVAHLLQPLRAPRLYDRSFRATQSGDADQVVDHCRIELSEKGQHPMADPGAEKSLVAVAGVGAVRATGATHERLDLCPRAIQQGTDHAVCTCGFNTRQPAYPAATDQTEEHGLRLIVARMAGRDVGAVRLTRKLMQRGVTQLPGTRLEVGTAANVDRQVRTHPADAHALRSIGSTLFIRLTVCATQAMIHMRGDEVDGQRLLQRGKNAQQSDGVSATGHRNEDARPGRQHTVRGNGALHASEHCRPCALHDTLDFDTLVHCSQLAMTTRLPRIILLLALVLVCARAAYADAGTEDGDQPSSLPTMSAVVKEVTDKHGIGAASLQGYLMGNSVSAGSQLEVAVSIAGVESRKGQQYLAYVLDTGIVYQEAEVTKREQLSHIWSDVVDPSLRKAAYMHLSGDGLALRVRSYRGRFSDRADIARAVKAQRLRPVEMVFVLPFDAIRAFVDGRLSARELTEKGEIEVDGTPTRLDLIPTPAATEAPQAER